MKAKARWTVIDGTIIQKEHFYLSRFYSEVSTLPHIWTKEEDALSWTTGGERKGLARCIQKHLEPLTDVQTIASGEVYLLIDCFVAKVFPDNKHCSGVMTDQVVKPQRN